MCFRKKHACLLQNMDIVKKPYVVPEENICVPRRTHVCFLGETCDPVFGTPLRYPALLIPRPNYALDPLRNARQVGDSGSEIDHLSSIFDNLAFSK